MIKSFVDKLDKITSGPRLRIWLYLLCAGAIFVNIKSIFADYDVDIGYAIATSYRVILGDQMFSQMWEPHQTSAFLTTFLMWCYHLIAGSWSGVVIYLHIAGVLLQGIVCIVVYKVLSKRMNSISVALMCIFLFAFRPKGIVFPEFSNMLIWFSVLLFLCLLLFLENKQKIRWLIAASACLCLQVLSYPSCLIVYFSVIVILVIFSDRKFFNAAIFTASCFLQGLAYILFFIHRIGFGELISCLENIVRADSSHGDSKFGSSYFVYLVKGGQWLAGCLFCTFLIVSIICVVENRKDGKTFSKERVRNQCVMIFSLLVFVTEVANALIYRDKFSYLVVFLPILLLGAFGLKYCNLLERQAYVAGMLLSSSCFLAVFLLTNLDILSVVAYLVLAIMVSFPPASRWVNANKTANVILLFCAIVIVHRGIIVKTIDGEPNNLFDLRGIIRSGPAKWVVTCYMGAYEEACDIEDWERFVMPGDSLLLVGNSVLYALPYMYKDVTISAPSTISTPTYDEMLLKYWEQNPDKYPNVIAVSCWYGELHIDEDSWIYQWIQDEFQPSAYVDGRYWRFYRLEAPQ